MSEIKTLADQLRETIRSQEHPVADAPPTDIKSTKPSGPPKKRKPVFPDEEASAFFEAIARFEVDGTEKSMIRVDTRTLNLLKRMKLAKGIDMNKFIVYSLHQYLAQHPWLAEYITETLKNQEL